MVCISSFMTLPHQFTTIRTIHKCEILTLLSDFNICWAKMCTGEETFHTPFGPLGVVIRRRRFLILVGWSILVVKAYIGFFLILVGLISGFNIII